MRTIDDKTLDKLIAQSLQKEHDIEQINTIVLKSVKHYNRIQRVKRVVRLAAIAFGAPAMLAIVCYGAYRMIMMESGAFSYIAVAIAVISAIAMTTYTFAIFSLD